MLIFVSALYKSPLFFFFLFRDLAVSVLKQSLCEQLFRSECSSCYVAITDCQDGQLQQASNHLWNILWHLHHRLDCLTLLCLSPLVRLTVQIWTELLHGHLHDVTIIMMIIVNFLGSSSLSKLLSAVGQEADWSLLPLTTAWCAVAALWLASSQLAEPLWTAWHKEWN